MCSLAVAIDSNNGTVSIRKHQQLSQHALRASAQFAKTQQTQLTTFCHCRAHRLPTCLASGTIALISACTPRELRQTAPAHSCQPNCSGFASQIVQIDIRQAKPSQHNTAQDLPNIFYTRASTGQNGPLTMSTLVACHSSKELPNSTRCPQGRCIPSPVCCKTIIDSLLGFC